MGYLEWWRGLMSAITIHSTAVPVPGCSVSSSYLISHSEVSSIKRSSKYHGMSLPS